MPQTFTRRQSLACFGLLTLTARQSFAAPTPKDSRPPKPLTFTHEHNGKVVDVPLGKDVVIELRGEQAQTGWEVTHIDGSELTPIKVGGSIGKRAIPETEFERFETGKSEADPAVGLYRFRFRADEEGTTDLTFRYTYPGGPIPPARVGTKCRGEFLISVEIKKTSGK